MSSLVRIVLAASLAGGVSALCHAAGAQDPGPLRVLRVTPAANASPAAQITASFDRPVAGSLDRMVDPVAVLRVEPAIPGKLEWRDPVTIRLVPSALLTPGASYTVTIANDFRAMDGSALAEPYRFTFRVGGPTLIGGSPVGAGPGRTDVGVQARRTRNVRLNQRFQVVYSSPVDLDKLTGAAYLEFSAACSPERIVRLRATEQRRISNDDPWPISQARAGFDVALDSLRRVVQLTPESPLPRACTGDLVVPLEMDEQLSRGTVRWSFETYGDFRIADLRCDQNPFCPRGPLNVTFSTPVSGSEVLHHVHLIPDAKFTVRDTMSDATTWTLEARLEPRVGYAVVADTTIRDIYGQPLVGNPAAGVRTTGYAPSITHAFGHLLVERSGFRTLSVQHVNIDTLMAIIAPIPDSLEPRVLSRFGWANDTVWTALTKLATTQRMPVNAVRDRAMLTNVHLPVPNARRPGAPFLYAVKISGRANGTDNSTDGPIAVVQVTDLGVQAKIGATEGAVWVTGVHDGAARPGATVVLYDAHGRKRATGVTDAGGLVRLTGWAAAERHDSTDVREGEDISSDGYVTVTLGDDRAVASVNRWDPDLAPWRFNVPEAEGGTRIPVAGAVFTERGIYRPGERVYAKAIVRDGALGTLRAPSPGDSIKWRFHDRERGLLRETAVRLSAFGTSAQTLDVPAIAPIGQYAVEVLVKRLGKWQSIASTSYRVAEYRPPEFLVGVTGDTVAHHPGDAFIATVQSRYLFGAPMGRAALTWMATQRSLPSWELHLPGLDDWFIGDEGSWNDDESDADQSFANGTDTLDVRGERTVRITLPEPPKGRAARVTLQTVVTDINRQVVGASTTTLIHPAEFYIAAKALGASYFWKVGEAQSIAVVAARPNGQRVVGVHVAGTIVRREWHRVRRERDGMSEVVGDWVSDTVGTCAVTTAADSVPCTFTPKAGGEYLVTFAATDRVGRAATTSFYRWVSGSDWVPWNDESQFKMDVIPDRKRYSVGDTATVLFASPFTNAEAWITVEREGLIEQRRMRLTSGTTTLKFPITEAFAPNAYVAIIVTRGRSAPPGPADDPGRPTIRVGYAELRVTPEVKRLAVTLAAGTVAYRPADTAHVRIRVRDAQGHGSKSEVTLWAVDEGVLALTGYKTPDPLDLIYRERGLGMRLASNMTSVAPQVPEGEKGQREPGGGGGSAGADVLRSRFQTTAFFLGSVVTDGAGNGSAAAKLPDNLTTFRLMAVAVTAGDRYGKGESSMLVTRPLLARPALPRFVRPGDQFTAGAVINRRDGAVGTVHVRATATGLALRGDSARSVTLAASRGAEVRFPFRAMRTDSATFRFDVTGDRPGEADAVRVSVPVRPEYHPRAHTVAGVLRDTASVELMLAAGTDPARSRLSLSLGTSPLAMMEGMSQWLRVYPYDCSEQVISSAVPLIALYRVQRQTNVAILRGNPAAEIARAVEVLMRRQRADGAIGYWSPTDWSTAWLSAYAGTMLLDARDVGVPVDARALSRLAAYIHTDLHDTSRTSQTPLSRLYDRRNLRLRDQVAAVDFLSRFGHPDIAAENELLRTAPLLPLEDRARLAEVLARRGQLAPAKQLMAATWSAVRVEGNRAMIPDSARPAFYFASYVRPIARILLATLAVEPTHPLIGPLVETLVQQQRAGQRDWAWNTQDYASAVTALAAVDKSRRGQGDRVVRVTSGTRELLSTGATAAGIGRAAHDSTIALTGLLSDVPGGQALRVSLAAGAGTGVVYYYLTVVEIPTDPPVTPGDAGIQVERWYERYPSGTPVTSVTEGDLVRVRLRVTVHSTRQFLVLDDALPAGLEAIDLSLRTASAMAGPGVPSREQADHEEQERPDVPVAWSGYGYWDSGWWSPFDHREIRDDRVVYAATLLWPGTYTASYIARATTPGTFIRPPAHSEEMYNPGANGRSDGGTFVVVPKNP